MFLSSTACTNSNYVIYSLLSGLVNRAQHIWLLECAKMVQSLDVRFVSIDGFRCQVVTGAAENFLITQKLARQIVEQAEAGELVSKFSDKFGRQIWELATNRLGELLPQPQPIILPPVVVADEPLSKEDQAWLDMQYRLVDFGAGRPGRRRRNTRNVTRANSLRVKGLSGGLKGYRG